MSSGEQGNVALMNSGQFFGRNAKSFCVSGFRLVENLYGKNSVTPQHAHTRPHFCWVLQGQYCEVIGSKTFERKPSTLMFLPAGVAHTESHNSMVRSFLIELEPSRFEIANQERSLTSPLSIQKSEIVELIAQLHLEFSQPDAWSALVIEALAIELLAITARHVQRRKTAELPKWVMQIKNRLHDEFLSPISLEQLAREVGRNPSHVARVFRLHFGMSIGQHVRQLRIEYAKNLLRDKRNSIADIALQCGFADQAHFSRCFQKVTGMTPSAFRREV